MRAAYFLVPILVCSSAFSEEPEIGDLLTRAATYIYDQDFIPGDPEQTFTGAELKLLAGRRDALLSMISQALHNGNSVGGAGFVGYFRLYDAAPRLRIRLLKPGSAYGWEGPNYSDADAILADNQYVFHYRYYNALLMLFGEEVVNKLNLTAPD